MSIITLHSIAVSNAIRHLYYPTVVHNSFLRARQNETARADLSLLPKPFVLKASVYGEYFPYESQVI